MCDEINDMPINDMIINDMPNIYLKPKLEYISYDLPVESTDDLQDNLLTMRAAANPSYFTAKDLATIYEFPTANTSVSSVIGVLSFGGGLYGTLTSLGNGNNYLLTNGDVQKYWAFVGIPANKMPKVIISLVGGVTNNIANDATLENTLDVSIIGACVPNPNLTIILYIYPNPYLFSVALANSLAGITVSNILYKPSILSISWGLSEQYMLNTIETTNVYNVLQTATENGVNICVAAGDNGSTDGSTNGTLYTDFPSSCPFLTAVGGTSLQCPNIIYDSQTVETVWNNGVQGGSISATGGGISRIYNKPSYQSNITSLSNTTMRSVPDIALDSDPNTGIVIYLNGQLVGKYGGTSIAAPLFASYLILINAKTFINPILYNIYNTYIANPTTVSCFHDIVLGSNYNTTSIDATKSYTATPGYDWCSGLGSIVGSALTNNINNTIPPTPPPPPPTPPQLATSISITPTSGTLNINETLQPTVIVLPENTANKVVNWVSSNINIATVNNISGLITAINSGSVIITASTTDGSLLSATVNITVNTIKATSISITPTSGTLNLNATLQPNAIVLPSNTTNKTLTWSSNLPNIATVNSSTGLITAKNVGSAIITATATDGSLVSSIITINVISIVKATNININYTKLPVKINLRNTYQFTATILPSTTTNKTINWSSNNNNIVSINNSGLATAKMRGITNIIAQTTDGSKKGSSVRVQII